MNKPEIINGRTVTFDPESHLYVVDGIPVPSVTQVVRDVLEWQYHDVDPAVLKRAADLGTALHKEIEDYENEGIMGSSTEFRNYLKLKRLYGFNVLESEKIIFIEDQGQVICAGRLDMILDDSTDETLILGDVKRTYNVHLDHLKLQLNLYKIGYEQCYKRDIGRLMCIHLRKHVHEIIPVDVDTDHAWAILDRFRKSGH
jgi:hypothetical protein